MPAGSAEGPSRARPPVDWRGLAGCGGGPRVGVQWWQHQKARLPRWGREFGRAAPCVLCAVSSLPAWLLGCWKLATAKARGRWWQETNFFPSTNVPLLSR